MNIRLKQYKAVSKKSEELSVASLQTDLNKQEVRVLVTIGITIFI